MKFGTATATALAGAALLVAVAGGCSGPGKNATSGGDTTCKQFNSQSEEQRNAAIAKMLKDRQQGKDPSDLAVAATRDATSAYCRIIGNDDAKISEMSMGES